MCSLSNLSQVRRHIAFYADENEAVRDKLTDFTIVCAIIKVQNHIIFTIFKIAFWRSCLLKVNFKKRCFVIRMHCTFIHQSLVFIPFRNSILFVNTGSQHMHTKSLIFVQCFHYFCPATLSLNHLGLLRYQIVVLVPSPPFLFLFWHNWNSITCTACKLKDMQLFSLHWSSKCVRKKIQDALLDFALCFR